jgi:predicted RNA binding protein YcfA (HicA-like mRNA interferase family)
MGEAISSLKSNRLLRIITSKPLELRILRRNGSHITLRTLEGNLVTFVWHSGKDVPGNLVRDFLVKDLKLTEEQAWKLVH